MLKKIFENINIIIVAIILLSSLLVGTPISESNVQIVHIALGVYGSIYFIVKLVKKDEIKLHKIDIIVALFVLAYIIPIIFKTYVSLSNTIHIIIEYFSLLVIYIIARIECQKYPKYKNIIINTIIISICILCVIGVDEITIKCLKEFKELFNYIYIEYDETRISSLFSYPNTMAAVAGMGIFLCISRVLLYKKLSIKILYIMASLLMLITLSLTYSRLVYIIFAIFILIYIGILLKKYNVRQRLNKKITIIAICFAIVVVIYIIIGLQISETLIVDSEYQKILYSVEPNKDYNFKFDISAISLKEDKFIITFIEKNKFFDDVNVTKIELEPVIGEKEILIHTQKDTEVMYIKINSQEEKSEIEIKKAYLNNAELILKYKLLPTGMVDKINSISFTNKSAWERMTFITDALKISTNNWLTGNGGNSWQNIQGEVQSYSYYAKEVHCFIVQIFLEAGIIGLISMIAIIIILLKKMLNKRNDIVAFSVIFSILFLLAHSLVDFDMSFYYVQMVVFVLIACNEFEWKNIQYNNVIYIVLIIVSIITLYIASVELYYKKHTEMLKVDSVWTEERILGVYNKLIPFNREVKQNYYDSIDNLNNTKKIKLLKNFLITERYCSNNILLDYIYDYIKICISQEKDVNRNIKIAIEYVKSTEEYGKYQVNLQIERLNNLERIINILEKEGLANYASIFKQQLVKELGEKEKYILDYQNSRYKKEEQRKYEYEIERLKKHI